MLNTRCKLAVYYLYILEKTLLATLMPSISVLHHKSMLRSVRLSVSFAMWLHGMPASLNYHRRGIPPCRATLRLLMRFIPLMNCMPCPMKGHKTSKRERKTTFKYWYQEVPLQRAVYVHRHLPRSLPTERRRTGAFPRRKTEYFERIVGPAAGPAVHSHDTAERAGGRVEQI